MAQPKYPKGLIVEFTFTRDDVTPAAAFWLDGNKKGRGVIVSFNPANCRYGVKIIEPPDWHYGNDCGGILNGKDSNKGWYFSEAALRPAVLNAAPSQSANAKTKSLLQKFATGSRVGFTYSGEDGNVYQVFWKNGGRIGRGIVRDYDDNPFHNPYAVEVITPASLKGKICYFDEDALREVGSANARTKMPAAEQERKDLLEFFKGEEKIEKFCPECGEPMRELLSSYYCPNGCDKKAH